MRLLEQALSIPPPCCAPAEVRSLLGDLVGPLSRAVALHAEIGDYPPVARSIEVILTLIMTCLLWSGEQRYAT